MVLSSSLLAAVPGLAHGFSTARGPAALCGPQGFDLGAGAPPAAWSWLAAQVGLPGADVALMHQVHGATVLNATAPGLAGEGDALIVRQPGLLVAVRVADCVPILLVDLDEVGRPVAAVAVHAGWRGIAAEVLPATLSALGSPPGRRLAFVGPCIGVDAYEVDAAVVEGIGAVVPTDAFLRPGRRRGRYQADLRAAVGWQLAQGAVTEVEQGPWCTWSDPDLHSFRRDGAAAGRLAGVVGWASA